MGKQKIFIYFIIFLLLPGFIGVYSNCLHGAGIEVPFEIVRTNTSVVNCNFGHYLLH